MGGEGREHRRGGSMGGVDGRKHKGHTIQTYDTTHRMRRSKVAEVMSDAGRRVATDSRASA